MNKQRNLMQEKKWNYLQNTTESKKKIQKTKAFAPQ